MKNIILIGFFSIIQFSLAQTAYSQNTEYCICYQSTFYSAANYSGGAQYTRPTYSDTLGKWEDLSFYTVQKNKSLKQSQECQDSSYNKFIVKRSLGVCKDSILSLEQYIKLNLNSYLKNQ